MRNLMIRVARTPVVGRSLLVLYRAKSAFAYFRQPLSDLARWLFTSKETTNFTYDLEETNKQYLAALIAHITNERHGVVMAFISEAETDDDLRAHILESTARSDFAFIADNEVHFGRRLGWYALTRILKPRIVVETGVDKGLGACLLTAALKRNIAEGYEGRYFGTDIDPTAGYLLSGDYAKYGNILYGDSIESLRTFRSPIDLFINDSDHSSDYEAEEYRMVADRLSANAIVLGDNSHSTDKLLDFSLQKNRHFIFFKEVPKKHWYPGGGIGISFTR